MSHIICQVYETAAGTFLHSWKHRRNANISKLLVVREKKKQSTSYADQFNKMSQDFSTIPMSSGKMTSPQLLFSPDRQNFYQLPLLFIHEIITCLITRKKLFVWNFNIFFHKFYQQIVTITHNAIFDRLMIFLDGRINNLILSFVRCEKFYCLQPLNKNFKIINNHLKKCIKPALTIFILKILKGPKCYEKIIVKKVWLES